VEFIIDHFQVYFLPVHLKPEEFSKFIAGKGWPW